jgi:ethanolamine transporter EutH
MVKQPSLISESDEIYYDFIKLPMARISVMLSFCQVITELNFYVSQNIDNLWAYWIYIYIFVVLLFFGLKKKKNKMRNMFSFFREQKPSKRKIYSGKSDRK